MILRLLLLTVFIFSSVFAQTQIAVVEFQGKGVSKIEASALTDRLVLELFRIGEFTVLERAMLDKIVEEQRFQLSGCNDTECLIELGRLANVQEIVSGSIAKVGGTYSISARLISVETGEILRIALHDQQGVVDDLLLLGMKSVAIQLSSAHMISSVESKEPTFGGSYLKNEDAEQRLNTISKDRGEKSNSPLRSIKRAGDNYTGTLKLGTKHGISTKDRLELYIPFSILNNFPVPDDEFTLFGYITIDTARERNSRFILKPIRGYDTNLSSNLLKDHRIFTSSQPYIRVSNGISSSSLSFITIENERRVKKRALPTSVYYSIGITYIYSLSWEIDNNYGTPFFLTSHLKWAPFESQFRSSKRGLFLDIGVNLGQLNYSIRRQNGENWEIGEGESPIGSIVGGVGVELYHTSVLVGVQGVNNYYHIRTYASEDAYLENWGPHSERESEPPKLFLTISYRFQM